MSELELFLPPNIPSGNEHLGRIYLSQIEGYRFSASSHVPYGCDVSQSAGLASPRTRLTVPLSYHLSCEWI